MNYLYLYISLIFIFISTIVKSDISPNELLIKNESGGTVYIKLYPNSALYNSTNWSSSPVTKYSLYWHLYDTISTSGVHRRGEGPPIKTILGLDGYALKIDTMVFYSGYFEITNGNNCEFSVDGSQSGEQDGLIGFGIYTLEIYKFVDPDFILICDPITLDWVDFNYSLPTFSGNADLLIHIRGDSSQNIKFEWAGNGGAGEEIPVFGTSPFPCPSPGLIQVYRQFYRYNIDHWEGYNVPNITHPRSFGISVTDKFILKYPLNGTQINTIYRIPQHLNCGLFPGNIIIDTNITTRDTLIDTITNLTVSKSTTLTIAANDTFNIIKPTIPYNGYNNLIIEDSATLSLEPFSHLIIGDRNKLTLKSKGLINFADPSIGINNAELLIESGALFCNEGGRINNGSITYGKGYNHHLLCATAQDVVYSDSTKIILSDSAVMEIPDGVTMHFNGFNSGLIMKPNSKLKLGAGCKIIFDSSASFVANGATFTSLDSTLKWEGIVLSNSDADTITNCTFTNAVTALTITNDANSAYRNRIITNNTFNVPSGGICKGIYGENNYKILLKGNTFNMPVYYPSASPVPLIYVGVYLKNSSTIEAAGGDIEED